MKRSLWYWGACGALLFGSGIAAAAEGDDAEAPRRNNRRMEQRGDQRRRGGMFGGALLNRISKEGEVQAKFGAEYAALAKQLVEAENKLAELAKKAKVELPSDNNMVLRQIKLKYPVEFAAVEKKLKERQSMREGMKELFALAEKAGLKLNFGFGMAGRNQRRPGESEADGPENRMRDNPAAKMRRIRDSYPEEWRQIQQFRREGKRADADALTRKLMERLDAERRAPQPPPPPAPTK